MTVKETCEGGYGGVGVLRLGGMAALWGACVWGFALLCAAVAG